MCFRNCKKSYNWWGSNPQKNAHQPDAIPLHHEAMEREPHKGGDTSRPLHSQKCWLGSQKYRQFSSSRYELLGLR